MKKITVIDMLACNKEEARREDYVEEVLGSWKHFYRELLNGSLDEINFDLQDIDQTIIYQTDDGEILRLKDGKYIETCWRGSMCRVWEVDDEEYLEYIKEF